MPEHQKDSRQGALGRYAVRETETGQLVTQRSLVLRGLRPVATRDTTELGGVNGGGRSALPPVLLRSLR